MPVSFSVFMDISVQFNDGSHSGRAVWRDGQPNKRRGHMRAWAKSRTGLSGQRTPWENCTEASGAWYACQPSEYSVKVSSASPIYAHKLPLPSCR